MAKKGTKNGMNSQEVYDVIVGLLKFLSTANLGELKNELDDKMEDVSSFARPWEKDGETPDDVLTTPEKMILIGIPGEDNPFTGRGKDKEGNATTPPKKINVIKMVRERLRYGLKQAKTLVDLYEAGVEEKIYTPPEGDAPEEVVSPMTDMLADGTIDMDSIEDEVWK